MTKLFFHQNNSFLQSNKVIWTESEYKNFYQQSEDLEERVEQMVHHYSKNPDSVKKEEVVELIADTYHFTVELFEAKMAKGEKLIAEEREIYDLCRQEIRKVSDTEQQLGSIYGALFNAIELVRNCIMQIKDWFNLTSEQDRADFCLIKAGNNILPGYAGIVEGFFTTIAEFFMPVFTPTIIGVAEAQAECALKYQEARDVDKTFSSLMLDIAEYAYDGHSSSKKGEFEKLQTSELPQEIRVLYDEKQGLLTSTKGLQVWLGKKDNQIVVSYSGTDIKDLNMVYADIIQLSAPSVLYLKAAGLLKLLLDYIPGKQFFVTGHSLGGGLTQFSLTANIKMHADRLCGYGFNPAGLSMVSLCHLEALRLKQACRKMWVFMTCYDPVSAVGGKIGCLTTLPKTDKNGHGMADLKVCMKKYREEPKPVPSVNNTITWRNHDETDFIPYTRKLSFVDRNGTVYPVFNDNVSSRSQNFIKIDIPEALFTCLNISKTCSDSCMGVYNKFNGTAHTVMNRILLLADKEPVVTQNSIGNIHSSIIYGKFGLGMQEFVPFLEKAYADSNQACAGSRTTYEKMLAKLNNPFEYDKQAWIDGIKIQFGIDMDTVFTQWPLAEKYFNAFLNSITSDRIDIYRSVYTGGTPDRKMILTFLSLFKDKVIVQAGKLMDEAVNWNVITEENKRRYESEIRDFCNRVLQGI